MRKEEGWGEERMRVKRRGGEGKEEKKMRERGGKDKDEARTELAGRYGNAVPCIR